MAAERIGMEDIKAGYDMFERCPFWALFETKASNSTQTGRMLFPYTGEDRASEGWELLKQNLQVLERTAPTIRHVLQFYNSLDKGFSITDKLPYSGSILLRMQEAAVSMPAQISGAMMAPQEGSMFLQYLQMQISQKDNEIMLLKEAVDDLEADVDDLEKEVEQLQHAGKPEKINGVIGMIGEVTNQYPVLGDMLKQILGGAARMFAGPGAPAGAMGKVSDETATATPKERTDEVIGQCIEKLASYYVGKEGYFNEGITPEQQELANKKGWISLANDLAKLANLTEDPDTFEFAIKKLRSA